MKPQNLEKASRPRVSVLIVTRNRKQELLTALASTQQQSLRDFECVVVDDASTDGTAEVVQSVYPNVRILRLYRNIGCPCARNTGFACCDGEFIYQLDDDGWLDPEALERATEVMATKPDVGVVACEIRHVRDGRMLLPKETNREARYCRSFMGGASMIRRAALTSVGIYPEDFFRQGEENDLALRMLAAGYRCYYEPASIMYHQPSNIERDHREFAYYHIRNTLRTALRYWPIPYAVPKVAACLWYTIVASVRLPYRAFPVKIAADLAREIIRMRHRRHPVSNRVMREFLSLRSRGH